MQALLVIDAQNEFSAQGLRAVPNHSEALERIDILAEEARREQRPIAWVMHHNKPTESRAFVPGSWGAEFSLGFGPRSGFGPERLFEKDVFGAFTGTGLEDWLRALAVDEVLIAGFYTHMCVSTSTREALVRDFHVVLDPDATGARGLEHDQLGRQTADEVRKSALLHLSNLGAVIRRSGSATAERFPVVTGAE